MPKTEAETPLYEPIASDGTPEKGAGCVPLLAQHKKKALAVALGVACTIGVVVAVAMPHKSTGDAGGSHAPSSGPCGGATCLPTHSSCSKICPGCDTLPCDCPPVDGHAACWPGSGLHNTPDHGCNCFAQLGFCNGTKPEYKPGVECPSCWPEDNHACDCFASLGFCGPGTDGPPFGIAGDFDSFVLARFWDPPAARHDAPVPRTNLSLHGVWPQYDKYMCDEEVLGTPTVQPCQPDKKASGHGWPQYCGAEHATNWQVLSEIEPTVRAHFFAQWAEYAPGYNNDPSFATHEWIKHGTCATPAPPSGEYSRAVVVAMQQRYFEMQIRLMETYTTPKLLQDCAQNGTALHYAVLRDAFGSAPGANAPGVALQCENVTEQPGVGRLTMVSMCFGSTWEGDALPTRIACSEETCLSSFYDNGCKEFERILVDGKHR